MRAMRLKAAGAAALVLAAIGAGAVPMPAARAEVGKTSAVDILFERKHLANVEAGADLTYHFQRSVSSPEVLGQPFTDDIHVQVRKIDSEGKRDVTIKVFSGERAREPQPIEGVTGNPILVVFLDRSIASYMSVAGGNVGYLKDKFRTAIRERSTVEPVKVLLGDKTVDAQKVTIVPYLGDLNASKMRGFEKSKFSIVLSDAVPGQFVELQATYESTEKGAPRFEEKTQMVGAQVIP